MDKSQDNSIAYLFGRNFIGPIFLGVVLILILAAPIHSLWNTVLCDVFQIFSPISYAQSVGLCTLVWCFGVIWRGVLDGKK